MTGSAQNSPGRVSLVGAGPGEDGLITVRGLQLLQRADVVIYDTLANERLLENVRPSAMKIPVRDTGRSRLSQAQINQLLLEHAQQGHLVVRLKGGDPYLFGRGAEEVVYLARHGIPCDVVPGVTAGIAAPMAAGVPLTRRDLASTVTFVTGHEDAKKDKANVDYASLAHLVQAGGTVCFYMGVGRSGAIAQRLQAGGLPANTPVAIVHWGYTPKQRSTRTLLGDTETKIAALGLGPPAIIVVGNVAAIQEPGLDFYTKRPLFGRRIVITRTRQQASKLRELLAEQGADVLEAPTIELRPPATWHRIDQQIKGIGGYDWVVLTSSNGASALAHRMAHLNLDARHLAGVKVAAIGDATEASVRQHLGVKPDLVPPHYVAESLGEALLEHGVQGQRFLLLRADIARPKLHEMLVSAGASVTELAIYVTQIVPSLPNEVLRSLRQGLVHWITFTSSSTARNTVELLGQEAALLHKVNIASIGPITSSTVGELGFHVRAEAAKSNLQGLIQAIIEAQS